MCFHFNVHRIPLQVPWFEGDQIVLQKTVFYRTMCFECFNYFNAYLNFVNVGYVFNAHRILLFYDFILNGYIFFLSVFFVPVFYESKCQQKLNDILSKLRWCLFLIS